MNARALTGERTVDLIDVSDTHDPGTCRAADVQTSAEVYRCGDRHTGQNRSMPSTTGTAADTAVSKRMKVGELFTAARAGAAIETKPCKHCGEPTADIEPFRIHFIVGDSGSKTVSPQCRKHVRRTMRPTGTIAQVDA